MKPDRRKFLQGVVAGGICAFIPFKGTSKRPFQYFDGMKYVDADPNVLLARLQVVAEELAFTCRAGKGDWFDPAELMNNFRWVFSIPKFPEGHDPRPRGREVDKLHKSFVQVEHYPTYWMGDNTSIGYYYDGYYSHKNHLDDGQVMKIFEAFADHCYNELFEIATKTSEGAERKLIEATIDDPEEIKVLREQFRTQINRAIKISVGIPV